MYQKNKEDQKALLEMAARISCEYLDQAAYMDAFPGQDALQELDRFDEPLPEKGSGPEKIINMLSEYGAPATSATTGGKYFGFVSGSVFPAALAAEWITDTWNQNANLFASSPISSKLEDICEKWLTELFGFPEGTAMGAVTGSSNALICGIAAARNKLLKNQGYDIASKGMRNAPKIRIVMSEDIHQTVRSGLQILGFGSEETELVPCDEYGRLITEKLPPLDTGTLVLIQAGNVNGGYFDPVGEVCDVARKSGAWVHVDGAFGLWAAASEKQRHNVAGLEKADSWSCDAHKTLNSGYDCGLVFCRDRSALISAVMTDAPYITKSDNRDNMFYTTEMSRRARGVILWACLKYLGKEGIGDLIDKLCDNAQYFGKQLEKAGIPPVIPPCFNQLMLKMDTPEKTRALLASIQESGLMWCGGSMWKGEPVIRLSVCSHATEKEDIDACTRLIADKAAFTLTHH